MYEPFLRETFFHTYVSDGIVSIAFWASLSAYAGRRGAQEAARLVSASLSHASAKLCQTRCADNSVRIVSTTFFLPPSPPWRLVDSVSWLLGLTTYLMLPHLESVVVERLSDISLIDPANGHMLFSQINPCMFPLSLHVVKPRMASSEHVDSRGARIYVHTYLCF